MNQTISNRLAKLGDLSWEYDAKEDAYTAMRGRWATSIKIPEELASLGVKSFAWKIVAERIKACEERLLSK